MTAADLDASWEGRTIAIHHNRRHHVGKVLRVGAAEPGTVVTDQEVPF